MQETFSLTPTKISPEQREFSFMPTGFILMTVKIITNTEKYSLEWVAESIWGVVLFPGGIDREITRHGLVGEGEETFLPSSGDCRGIWWDTAKILSPLRGSE
ncbi:hypothetical protein CLV93_103160 [Prolixibacter denitrificans]|uniref:Uncharacterized protein n=1 Tax=Prolixibacter denitrificans TaxID=1541063 RepID=A0A2P8CFI9_9BACT|nr:hypothetical protein CLV93_103160 [Prolixibacter denitrificans]GET23289.1 hypothetical protein JCM18694_35350 [Prolixibacter denitrificans]